MISSNLCHPSHLSCRCPCPARQGTVTEEDLGSVMPCWQEAPHIEVFSLVLTLLLVEAVGDPGVRGEVHPLSGQQGQRTGANAEVLANLITWNETRDNFGKMTNKKSSISYYRLSLCILESYIFWCREHGRWDYDEEWRRRRCTLTNRETENLSSGIPSGIAQNDKVSAIGIIQILGDFRDSLSNTCNQHVYNCFSCLSPLYLLSPWNPPHHG